MRDNRDFGNELYVVLCLIFHKSDVRISLTLAKTTLFQDKWSLEAIFQLDGVMQSRLTFGRLNSFSSRYQLPGLKEFYEETWSMSSYIFKPRRVPSAGGCAETIA